jgi:hypothetical protein
MNVVVYTAIFGERYDPLPAVHFGEFPHVLVTDQPERYKGRGWRVQVPGWSLGRDPRLAAREVKLNPEAYLPDAEVSLWVDGNVGLRVDPLTVVRTHFVEGSPDLWMPKHPLRSCIFTEMRACAALRKDSSLKLLNQITAYEDHGFPRNAGLWETGYLLRRHTPQIAALNREWLAEVKARSSRDQISLPYVRWKLGVPIGTLPGRGVAQCPYAAYFKHGGNPLARSLARK